MGRLVDIDVLFDYFGNDAIDETTRSNIEYFVSEKGTVEAIPKDNIYKAIQEMMKYEHEGFINISLTRLDEILKKYGVCEDEKEDG